LPAPRRIGRARDVARDQPLEPGESFVDVLGTRFVGHTIIIAP
jgi:hypothetical protein